MRSLVQFKVDENLPNELIDLLRENGHDATTVHQQDLGGASDSDISRVCIDEQRALITLDTDFADIRTYPPKDYCGLLVLRLRRQDRPHVLAVMTRLLRLLPEEPLAHHLWIVEDERIRISGEDNS